MSRIETVKIIRTGNPHEYVVINKDDLKPEDKLYQAPQKRGRKPSLKANRDEE